MTRPNKYPQIIYSNRISSILALPTEPKRDNIKPIIYPVVLFALFLNIVWICGTIEIFKEGSILWGIIQSILNIGLFFFVAGGIITIYDSTIGYKVKHRKWEKQVADLETNDKKRVLRKKMIASFLKERSAVEVEDCEQNEIIKKGISEKWFYQIIKDSIEMMGGKVSLDKKVVIYNDFSKLDYTIKSVLNPKYYYPDIAILVNNLYIAVEIDEPYAMDSRLPVHCIGSDDYRNNYISSQGWEIIRFSEKQIVDYPEKCIATITKMINHILEGRCDSPIIDSDGSWIMNRWDESSAKSMARSNYRESYLYNNKGNLRIQ